MNTSTQTVCGIEAHILEVGEVSVVCLSDPAPTPWRCDSLLVGMTPERMREAEDRLGTGLVDAAAGTITISFNTFLIRRPGSTIIVDAGIGNDKQRPERPMWHERSGRYLDALGALGVLPDEVDVVLSTHLHADHTGWNTRLERGCWVPTFPRARYICTLEELDYWKARYTADLAKGARTLFGSFEDSVLPIQRTGQLEAVPSNSMPINGIRFVPAPGHSPGMIAVEIETGAQPLHLWSDIAHHLVQFLWNDVVSIACTDAALARQTRLAAIERALDTDAIVAATHFAAPVFGRLCRREGQVC